MEVVDRKHALLSRFDPLSLATGLAGRTVAIAARVVDRPRETAGGAHLEVAAEGRCPAAGDIEQGGAHLVGQALVFRVRCGVVAEDLCHLDPVRRVSW
jgi:hypothetical protein